MKYEIKLLPIQKKLYSSEKEFAGIYSSRSTGKTYVLSWLIALAVIKGEKSLAFSQTYKSLTQNLFQEIMARFRELGIDVNYNKSAVTIEYNGGCVYGYSYDSAESTRGQTNVNNLFLDELALANSDLLAIVGPCLRGAGIKPKVRFCSTPRTSSYWNRIVKEHLRIKDWDIFTGTFRDNTFLSPESVQMIEQSVTDPILRRQELEGEIIDSVVENCIVDGFTLSPIKRSSDNEIVMGVDVARFGNDSTVICIRDSYGIIEIEQLYHKDTYEIVSEIEKYISQYNVKHVYLDATGGYSSGIEDTLKLKYDFITPVNFGSKSQNNYNLNVRADIYFNLVDGLRDGFYIDSLKYGMLLDELYATSYIITNNGKKALVPKEKIKEIIGHSPDSLDALALTFYKSAVDTFTVTPEKQKLYMNSLFR